MFTRIIKYIILASAFCFYHVAIIAQNKNIDSLLVRIKNDKQDTVKVIDLIKLSREYLNAGLYDKAFLYGNVALQMSQQLDFKKGIANSYGVAGSVYSNKRDFTKALDYYFKALAIRKEINDRSGMVPNLGNIATVYKEESDFSNALDYYFKAIKIAEELGDKGNVAVLLGNIGLVYFGQSNYPKTLNYYFQALKMDEELGNKNGVARHLGNIGLVYNKQEDYNKAKEYYFKALKMNEELGIKFNICAMLSNIGLAYSKQRDYLKALDYYFKALKLAQEINNNELQGNNILNIGNVYLEQNNYSKAIDYYFKALKIDEESGDKIGIATCLGNIGSLKTATKKYGEAYNYLSRSLSLNDSLGVLYNLKDNYIYLSELYQKSNIPLPDSVGGKLLNMEGMRLLSLHYLWRFIAVHDTIFSQENKKELVRKEMNYEFGKKEAFIKTENEKQQAIADETSRKQKEIIWSIASGLLLVVVFAGFVFRSLRVTRKQKQIIEIKSKETEEQKKVIERQKKVVEEKNKDITDSINYARRIQRAMLPHRKDIWQAFPQSFVFFKPKDIVSGDFYFFHKNNETVFIAVADCTGHGVPGAFMSMVGAGKLNEAVSQSTDISEVLSLLNKGIKIALKQSEGDKATRDGMDIALCSVDKGSRIVKYAGANRPIWIIRKGQKEVEEIKATKKAIGGFTEDSQHFDTQEIKLQQGDTFYISTDGYADQFGGPEGKKLMTKRFKETLLEIQDKTMKEQEQYLEDFVEDWKARTEQVDDILVIGIRL